MSNWLAGKGYDALEQIWMDFVDEHDSAATKAWREVDLSIADWCEAEGSEQADYIRRLICCGWKHLAEEQKAD